LPSQLKLKEVSPELRARLWAIFLNLLQEQSSVGDHFDHQDIQDPFLKLLYDWHITRCFKAADEFTSSFDYWLEELKTVFMEGDYLRIFGFVQWVLRHKAKPYRLELEIDNALRKSRAAYAIFDDDTIIPVGSDAERATLQRAFADVAASEFHGARAHLRNAGSELTEGNYGPSIRESIHAVEAAARVLEPGAQTLGPALSKLENSVRVHPALGKGFGSLYGFTST
jgi:hypothetical protein